MDVDIDTEASKRSKIIEATRKKYGYNKVLNICTFKTEGSKSAILTSARGLGIESDVAAYLASMIPIVRGSTTSLNVMINGNPDEGIRPNKEFINECAQYPRLLETALTIEGLVCGRSVHASGVIICEDEYIKHNAMMRAPSGQPITQWDMDDSVYCGGLKFDYLTVSSLDSMHVCLDFLIEHGHIKDMGSLRKNYNEYFHPDKIDGETLNMWKMAENLEVVNLFQMNSGIGSQAIQKVKPRSLLELGVANSVMRLMVESDNKEDSPEQPLDTYVKYRTNIESWYDCMRLKYELTEEEIIIVERYLKQVDGMASMQEEVMLMSMDEDISGFSMGEANKLRKSIAKKKKKLQLEAKEMFYTKGKNLGTSDNLLDYIWHEVIGKQLGYSFSLPHVIAYSIIALQQMNMAYHYPTIYWNTANLIVDSGAMDDEDENVREKATKYGKMATAVANMQHQGVEVTLPLINEAKFGFVPDEYNNRILFSLKALCNVGDDTARLIVSNQPYSSLDDFCERMIDTKAIKPSVMLILIKAGAFTLLHSENRAVTMKEFIKKYKYKECTSLTLSQLNRMKELDMIPDEMQKIISFKNFKDYVLDNSFLHCKFIDKESKRALPKCGYNDLHYKLNEVSMPYFIKNFSEDSVVGMSKEFYLISEKKFLKEIDKKLEPLKEWFALEETLNEYNKQVLEATVAEFASGTVSKWEMDALSFYHGEHELEHINETLYGVVDFTSLSETPEVYETYTRNINGSPKNFNKNTISRIAGTVLDRDNAKHLVTVLTKYGVVTVKFNKGQYNFYNRQIKTDNKIEDKSWFTRGNKVIICGYRRDAQFIAHKYQDTIYKHTCMLIEEVYSNGEMQIRVSR